MHKENNRLYNRMGTIKTRSILIDVARRLFAAKGVENTTMNDIAVAAQKGRRTLYTYFKSKDEVYSAVIETELFQLAHKLQEELQKSQNPAEKLINYIYVRMDYIQEVVQRNGNLNASFFSNIHLVEKVRHKLDLQERKMLEKILIEGNARNMFNVKNTKFAAAILQCSLKGWEVPFIRGELNQLSSPENKKAFSDFLLCGLTEINLMAE